MSEHDSMQWAGPALFKPIQLRDLEVSNRVWVSPMCQYSAEGGGSPTDWHLVHLGSLAKSGAGLVFTEATSVEAVGRISPADTGIWHDDHIGPWRRITGFLHDRGAKAGMQLGHAGRKGSSSAPWHGGSSVSVGEGGWETISPSAIPFGDHAAPRAMTDVDLDRVRDAFVAAAGRALEADFDVIELHTAHGYLLHQFLSPLSNQRPDRWGGDLEGRMRYPLSVVQAVRQVWPADRPLFVRVSASDWAPEDGPAGWTLEETVAFAGALAAAGVDLVDCSSGGTLAKVSIPVGPGYQVPFAAAVRARTGIATGAVGMITDPAQAESIVATGQADAVFLARELLRHPTWPLDAARQLRGTIAWPEQYERARLN